MNRRRSSSCRAFTLIEAVLVIGIVAVITAMILPNFIDEIRGHSLEGSARQVRSMLTLVGANACFDGVRYRLRFPELGEEDLMGGNRQPLIEREDDPLEEPEVFNAVTDPWAIGATLLEGVWCAEVRRGRPTATILKNLEKTRSDVQDALDKAFEDFSPERPPVIFEADGTTGWFTFVLTDAPPGTELDDLENYDRIEVLFEGDTGMVWLQRPFYEEELDLFEEKNWPVVLRQDFLSPKVLTEDDVLELYEVRINQ
ncbi:MAG: hypothetical protein KJ749_04260 [Planctomycetes bacterium]|nr:hypothetical protein [Planctomycetota bacterium]